MAKGNDAMTRRFSDTGHRAAKGAAARLGVAVALACCLATAAATASPVAYLRSALDNNPEQRRAQLGIKAAEESLTVARAARLPQVRSAASYRLDTPRAQGQGNAPDRLNAQVVINQQVFNLESESGLALAGIQLEIAKNAAEAARQQVLLATYRAYLATALAAENLLLLDKRRETLEEQFNIASSNFEVGRSTRLQVLNVQAQIAALDAEQVSAENALVSAGDNLESLSGKDPDDIRRLLRAPATPSGGLSSWMALVPRAPAVWGAALEVDAQQERTRQLVGSVLPSLIVEGTMDKDLETAFSLQLSAPLFSSGGATAAKRGSEQQEQVLIASHESIVEQTTLQVSQAYRDLVQNKARTEALRESVAVGQERLDLAQTSIELEAGILADALDAATDLAQAELQLAQARHGQMEAYLTLLATTGEMDLDKAEELEALFK